MRCQTSPSNDVPDSTTGRRSSSSDSPSVFLITQCRANARKARVVSASPSSLRGTGSRCVSATPPTYGPTARVAPSRFQRRLSRHFPGELPRVCFRGCEPAGAIHAELRKLTAVARDGGLLPRLLRGCQSTWCGPESRRIDTDVHQPAEQPADVRWPAGGK